MADRDRWNDDRSDWARRRSGGERDFYGRDNRSDDDYGRGYGEEGLTNYNARSPRGVSPGSSYGSNTGGYRGYGGGERDVVGGGGYGRGDYGSQREGNQDWGRGDYGRDFGNEPRNRNFGDPNSDGYGPSRYGRQDQYGRDQGRGHGRDEDRGLWDRASDEVASWFGSDDAESRRRDDARQDMRHQGRGPKGYRRSDDRVREDVNDRLTDDPYIDASEIDVKVANGEVTLTGTVNNRLQRRRAEDLAERISGVNHVQNNLRVSQNEERAQGSSSSSSTGVNLDQRSTTTTPGTRT